MKKKYIVTIDFMGDSGKDDAKVCVDIGDILRSITSPFDVKYEIDELTVSAMRESDVAPGIKLVNTDNYGGDYPNEYFLNAWFGTKEHAQEVADLLNKAMGQHADRWWKVVDAGYKLQPGFEP
jgi:hypothetical protein